jgi:hypothetical protein
VPQPGPPAVASGDLAQLTGPAWILDVYPARIVTANLAACAAWGSETLDGLALVRALVQASQGQLAIDRGPAGGARVSVIFTPVDRSGP